VYEDQIINIPNTINGTHGNTLNEYCTRIDEVRDDIIDTIFSGEGSEHRGYFDAHFNPYRQAYHLISRDWKTTGDSNLDDMNEALKEFKEAFEAVDGFYLPLDVDPYDTNRGFSIPDIGDDGAMEFLGACENNLLGCILNGLGINVYGGNGLNPADANKIKEMAKTLVIQLGQDAEESRSFIEDINAEDDRRPEVGFDELIEMDCSNILTNNSIASANTQSNSNIHLASHIGRARVPGTKFA
jgi:hypothetical protein